MRIYLFYHNDRTHGTDKMKRIITQSIESWALNT